ncbi:MAG TPA: GNAT family N-acetyltransferase [Chthoniobacterales bacterium]
MPPPDSLPGQNATGFPGPASRDPGAPPAPQVLLQTPLGSALVVERIPPEARDAWERGLAACATDHRYYELTQDTLGNQFQHRYLLLRDRQGTLRAVQPFLIVSQDLVTGVPRPVRRAVQRVRKVFPRFLKLKMIMVGCSAGEGDLAHGADGTGLAWTAKALGDVLPLLGRRFRASLIVFKDFPAKYRTVLDPLTTRGFARIPSMPATGLNLDFDSFEGYMAARLSHAMRKNLRRKFRKAMAGAPVVFEACNDASAWVNELVPLYRAVFERSELKFEELNADYLRELGRRMPDRARFFLWRLENRVVAFASCLVHDGVLKDNYIGLDYSVALDRHLYFLTWRDTITWAIQNGCHTYHSAPLNYDPKLHFRMHLEPLDLYVRPTYGWLGPVFRRFLPLLEPTRYDRAIQQFPNKKDLW